MFQISDKVVCVDDGPVDPEKVMAMPLQHVERGIVYVVRDIRHADGPEGYAIYLTGIQGGTWYNGDEAGWRPSRFRKLSEVQAENELRRTVGVRDDVKLKQIYP